MVTLFEIDVRLAGGIFGVSRESSLAGTTFLAVSAYVHLFFAVGTALVWAVLMVATLRTFPVPPRPGPFSRQHRLWGSVGMIGMTLTGITGIEFYVIGMVL